jgi:hypothetical protein
MSDNKFSFFLMLDDVAEVSLRFTSIGQTTQAIFVATNVPSFIHFNLIHFVSANSH